MGNLLSVVTPELPLPLWTSSQSCLPQCCLFAGTFGDLSHQPVLTDPLLSASPDEREPEEIRERARKRCTQILDFAEAYQRDFLPPESAPGPSSEAPGPLVARTVSVASSVAGAEPLLTRQLVHAEVLHSADLDTEPEPEPGREPEPREPDMGSTGTWGPELPDDGDDEFHPLSCSIASLRFADGELRSQLDRRSHQSYSQSVEQSVMQSVIVTCSLLQSDRQSVKRAVDQLRSVYAETWGEVGTQTREGEAWVCLPSRVFMSESGL